MILYRRIGLIVMSIIVLLQIASLLLLVVAKRDFLQQLLQQRAMDSAASIAYVLSKSDQVIDRSLVKDIMASTSTQQAADLGVLNIIIEALFVQGHYSTIDVLDVNGEVLLHREIPMKVDGVPAWFVTLFPLDSAPGVAKVIDDGQASMTLMIGNHPGEAYLALWDITRKAVVWLVGSSGILILIYYLLSWRLLNPINELAQYVRAVSEQSCSYPVNNNKQPNELQVISTAFQTLNAQINGLFKEQVSIVEQVREQVHVDPVTGMGNQNYFYARFFAAYETADKRMMGALFVLKLKDYSEYNARYGHIAGDLLLKQLAGRWMKVFQKTPECIVAKRPGAGFIAWLPKISVEQAESDLQSAFSAILSLPNIAQEERINFIHIGAAHSDRRVNCDVLLNTADSALSVAQSKGANSTHLVRTTAGKNRYLTLLNALSADQWRNILLGQDKGISLQYHVQSVLSVEDDKRLSKEVLLRLDAGGELISAELFIPLVERFGLQLSWDKLVILNMIEHIKSTPNDDTVYSINISPFTLQQDGFVSWLLSTLSGHPSVVQQLMFEVPEHALGFLIAKIQTLATGLKTIGGRMVLDRFGAGWQGLSFLNALPLYAIKIDYSYIRNLAENYDYQFLVKSLISIAHSRDILVLAGNVESAAQWSLLKAYGIDGGQGYFLSSPQPLLVTPLQMSGTITDNIVASEQMS